MSPRSKPESYPRALRHVILGVLPVLAVLATEVIGGWRFGKDPYYSQYAINLHGLYRPIILVVVGAAVVSPLLVLNAFRVVRSDRPRYNRSLYRGVFLLLTISLLISMVSCFWTCGGHPTWTNGYK
jgi:hypothetical protein